MTKETCPGGHKTRPKLRDGSCANKNFTRPELISDKVTIQLSDL